MGRKKKEKTNFELAKKRYEALLNRCFDRLLQELFLSSWLKGERYSFRPEDLKRPLDIHDLVRDDFCQLFKDLAKVRVFNKAFKEWRTEFKDQYTKQRKEFKPVFESLLPEAEFSKEFFGKDIDNRCCVYCGISEEDIAVLSAAGEIATKRFYSRGKTMEIDQVQAYGGYTIENIVLSCYWCNNAKTDEFSFGEFMEIGKSFSAIWRARLEKLKRGAA